jgi:hypothetical protein
MRDLQLPPHLLPGFIVREALEAGVAASQLSARSLLHPFHGARTTRELSPMARLELLMRALPSHAFACGPTAGVVLGVPLPAALHDDAFGRPTIGVSYPSNRIRGRQVRGRSLKIADDEVLTRRRIRVTRPSRTWRDLSAELDLPAFVAVTDFLIARDRRRCTIDQLTAEHTRAPRSPGAGVRRRALELCSERSESPRESELRCVLELAGLPRPECNVEIYDGTRFVARVDMLYRAQKLIIEYYGDYHRDPDQWSRDEMRRAELESLGYRVTVVTRRDFDDLPALAARIHRLLSASAAS